MRHSHAWNMKEKTIPEIHRMGEKETDRTGAGTYVAACAHIRTCRYICSRLRAQPDVQVKVQVKVERTPRA